MWEVEQPKPDLPSEEIRIRDGYACPEYSQKFHVGTWHRCVNTDIYGRYFRGEGSDSSLASLIRLGIPKDILPKIIEVVEKGGYPESELELKRRYK